MADNKNAPPAGSICGKLDNPGNANPSTVVVEGQGPYLMINYINGAEAISVAFSSGFESGPSVKVCPKSCVTFAVVGPAKATITYNGQVDLKWCWTEEADGCCTSGK